MEPSIEPGTAPGAGPRDLIREYLDQQQSPTAVETFSLMHEHHELPAGEKYYKSLLPAREPEAGQQYAFEVDLDKCTGCKACVTGCHSRNGLDEDETWRLVSLLSGGAVQVSEQSDNGASCSSVKDAAPFQQHVTAACHHCLEPACLSGCPVNAYDKDPFTGIVKHLDDQCIGCQYCLFKCPYGVPQYSEARGIVRKCDMCTDRLSAGEAPACVQSCPNDAISITVVDTAEVGKDPDSSFGLPQSPDARYTAPTTRYRTARDPAALTRNSVSDPLSFQPSEWPLAWMLVLTQASVGGLVAHGVLGGGPLLPLLSAALGLIGLAVAPLHLGRPLYAFRVFLGLRTSWLSREAVVLGMYQGAVSGYAVLSAWAGLQSYLPVSFLAPGLLVLSGLSGLAGVFSSAMIYIDTPRKWWASPVTAIKFFGTAVVTGLALGLAASTVGGEMRSTLFLWTLLALFLSAKLLLEASVFLHSRPASPFRGTASLMSKAKGLVCARFGSALTGGILLPAGTLLWEESAHFTPLFFLGAALVLAGEFAERILFFKTVVPPQMPGRK